jgi:uroporphyrinogen decarboxylase
MKFEPVAYDHAAFLIGKTPYEVSRDSSLLSTAQLNFLKTYNYDISVVGVDIYNVEVEAYGSELKISDPEAMPSVEEPLLNKLEDILKLKLDPKVDGRFPIIFEAAEKIRTEQPKLEVRIPISGPFTIACHLMGLQNMICEMVDNPELAQEALDHLADNQIKIVEHAIKNGFGISLFESAAAPPLLSPRMYKKYATPPIAKIFNALKGKSIDNGQFVIGGNTYPVLGQILDINASYIICPVETDQQEFINNIPDTYLENRNIVRINMKPASFLNSKEEAITEAKRALEIANGKQNVTIGSLIPYDADKEIVIAVSEYLKDK